MALKFHKLEVKNKIQETPVAVSLVFNLPDDLKSEYDYKSGQYLTLRFFINEKDQRRAYSFASSPYTDQDIKVTIKEVQNGIISNHISKNVNIGDMIDVMTPTGNFTANLNKENSNHYFMFAGGSGITPIISLTKSILFVEKKSSITLVYGNKTKNSIIFQQELQELKNKYDNLKLIHILDMLEDGFEAKQGIITSQIVKEIIEDTPNYNSSLFYLCGPAGFINIIDFELKQYQIDKDLIHTESFSTTINETSVDDDKIKRNQSSSNVLNDEVKKVKIVLYGEELDLEVIGDETIIEACQREGIEAPYSCCVGACSTCISKLESGEVEMDDDMALTDDEKEEGLILACTSHPLTDDVKIDFDYY